MHSSCGPFDVNITHVNLQAGDTLTLPGAASGAPSVQLQMSDTGEIAEATVGGETVQMLVSSLDQIITATRVAESAAGTAARATTRSASRLFAPPVRLTPNLANSPPLYALSSQLVEHLDGRNWRDAYTLWTQLRTIEEEEMLNRKGGQSEGGQSVMLHDSNALPSHELMHVVVSALLGGGDGDGRLVDTVRQQETLACLAVFGALPSVARAIAAVLRSPDAALVKSAEEALRDALNRSGNLGADEMLARGSLLAHQGLMERARATLEELVSLRPEWSTAHQRYCQVLAHEVDMDGCVRECMEAVRLSDGYDLLAAMQMSACLWSLGRPTEAIDSVGNVLGVHPTMQPLPDWWQPGMMHADE